MGKHILLTGAGRGIGLEMTRQLLAAGHSVAAISRKKSEALGKLLDNYPGQASFTGADVSNEEEVRKAAALFIQKKTVFDLIINNAAVHLEQDRRDILDLDFSLYLPTVAVNSVGPLVVCKHFLPLMRRPGVIASISSEAGSIADCWRKSEFSYCMSKAALNMNMKILQNRLEDEHIKVLCIHPGWVRTDMGGMEATLSPEESASGVIARLFETHDLKGPMYLDWQGNEMHW
ncbi:MAG: SDR family NAD(P)-dependent oxidoreductase [Spirochaetales bacterium]|nr:SDR family NAD(P)-dependent oxidoreductase [Spirochaetales bacterium]